MAPVRGGQFFGGSTPALAAGSTPLETLIKPTATGLNLVLKYHDEVIYAQTGE